MSVAVEREPRLHSPEKNGHTNGSTSSNVDQMILGNSGMVYTAAEQLLQLCRDSGIEFEDALQQGFVGLIDAAKGFNPEKGTAFSTYAHPRIRGEIYDMVRARQPLSKKVARDLGRIEDFEQEFIDKNNRKPNTQEIAQATSLNNDQITEAKRLAPARERINFNELTDSRMPEEEDSDYLPEEALLAKPDPFEKERIETIAARLLRILNDREKQILRLYFINGLNQRQIAEQIDVGKSCISHQYVQAIHRIRIALNLETPKEI